MKEIKNCATRKEGEKMNKVLFGILVLAVAFLGNMTIIDNPPQAANDSKGNVFVFGLRQGPFFKLDVTARYQEVDRYAVERRFQLAVEGLQAWGWISQFRGLTSSTKFFLVNVDVNTAIRSDPSGVVTVTSVDAFGLGGRLVASRKVEHAEAMDNPERYREAVAMAVEQVQLEAMTEGKEIFASCTAAVRTTEGCLGNK